MNVKYFTFFLAAIATCGVSYGNENFEVMLKDLGAMSEEASFSSEKTAREICGWVTYKQGYGTEKVEVQFPKIPRIKKEKHLVFTYAQKRGVQYTLITSSPPIQGMDPKQAFVLAMASLDQDPNYLIDYATSKSGKNHQLDMISQNYRSETVTKTRMIVTPNNFYILRTVFPEDRSDDHNKFTDSFFVW